MRGWLLALLFTLLPVLLVTGCGVTTCLPTPAITGQPSNQTVTVGQPAFFTVAASGTQPLSYQWFKNGAMIPGATQASYLTPVTTATDSSSAFTVTISDSIGSITSDSASLTVNTTSPTNVRFVAPNGNDSNPGTIDHPYLTIQHCATTVAQGWTCAIRAGTYHETVTPNSGITVMAYNFETVTVDGTDPITGWTLDHDSIYKTSVTLATDDTNQIFVGSEMMTEARWPNGDDLFHVNWAHAQAGTDTGHIVDPNLPSGNWSGARVHMWSGSDPFGHQTGTVTASTRGQITIDVGQTGTCPSICPAVGGLYYLFGTLSALDTQREWFYDPSSTTLYFMAPGAVNPNQLDVRAKRRQYAFDLRGKSGVILQNINLFASTIVTDENSSNNTLDRINAQFVSQFTTLPVAPDDPTGSNFSILQVHVTDSGIVINGSGNILQNSTIAYSAGTGIAINGNNNIVRNNLIDNIDYVGDYASGIVLGGQSNTIQYNTVNNVGRQAIYVTGALYQDIGYNNLFDSMMLSRDGAEIYACCNQAAVGTRVHHNWLHDTLSLIKGNGDTNALSGIGIDNGSSGFEVDQNELWNNQRYNVLINGVTNNGANTNNVHNNTIPDAFIDGGIGILAVSDCTLMRVVDNRVAASILSSGNGTPCAISNNQPHAPGATDMSITPEVGCNFNGCSSTGPPAILDNGLVSPCPASSLKGTF